MDPELRPIQPLLGRNSRDTPALRVRSERFLLKDYISRLPLWTTEANSAPIRGQHPIFCGHFGHRHTWVPKNAPLPWIKVVPPMIRPSVFATALNHVMICTCLCTGKQPVSDCLRFRLWSSLLIFHDKSPLEQKGLSPSYLSRC